MTRSWASHLTALLLASTLAGQSASAQVNEADRLQRCANNRDALVRAQNGLVLSGYLSDEALARTRTAHLALQRDNAIWISAYYRAGDNSDPRLGPASAELAQVSARMAETLRSIGSGCGLTRNWAEYAACLEGSPLMVQGMIRAAENARAAAQPILQQIANYQTNLVALRCDQTGARTITSTATGIPNVAGFWHGVIFDTDYIMSQSGAEVTWSAPKLSETASGSFADGLLTMRWSGIHGSHEATGTVISDANGVATEIRWTNGNVFTRQ
ncbi:MAG: hypothetical protein ACREBO_00730 [Novosphingobium sp.]